MRCLGGAFAVMHAFVPPIPAGRGGRSAGGRYRALLVGLIWRCRPGIWAAICSGFGRASAFQPAGAGTSGVDARRCRARPARPGDDHPDAAAGADLSEHRAGHAQPAMGVIDGEAVWVTLLRLIGQTPVRY